MNIKYFIFICVSLCCFSSLNAQNLLINGDFESGSNGVGFSINSCCYNEITQPFSGNTLPGNYAVTNNPYPMNTAGWISDGDHTTGSGNMLVVDGTTTGGSQRFWRAGNVGGGVCGLTIGTIYTFSYWIKSVATAVTGISSQANIGFQFNNASNITLVSGSALAPLPSAGWQQVVYTFTPTNNCVNIELWDNNTTATGNDFAVDDFSLTGPPKPFSVSYSSINPSCTNANDGSIIGYGTGANPPYEFFLTGPVTANNSTGVFTNLSAGTYTLLVIEGADGQITINNIVLSNPPNLTISTPTTICNGASTTLSVSGSSTGYTWTASPNDPTLTTPNSPNPTVSPTQTTTYTVTSTTSNTSNLIYNSDFSLGNTGFLTDYIYYTPNNPTGIQKSYGMVTNANAWETGFSSCADHTSGTGTMMVIDGSPANSGNDKVWCQTMPVTPNQNYTFSYWIQTVANPNTANIDVKINGTSIGTAFAPATTCNWVQHTYTWNSGSNTVAQICLYDKVTNLDGNDFALDDISFVGSTTTCSLSKSVTITVGSNTIPTFNAVNPICAGGSLSPLPTTSLNGITGTWSPALDNTTTTLYTFTPNPNQCATTATLQITVNVNTAPTFAFNSTETYCLGTPINAPLPTLSTNSITGTWNPVGINTQLPGNANYTFTPAANQCASSYTLTVTVLPNITPSFSQVNPICIGETLAPLPTLSNNNIIGTWTPVLNNTTTTIYTFTPNSSQCSTNTTIEIIVNNNATPVFDFGNSLTACYKPITEGPQAPLPTTSNNGINGYWSPAAINYSLLGDSVYTFTPNNSLCSSPFTLTVTIVDLPTFTVNAGCDGDDFVLSVTLFEIEENSNFTWYNDQNEIIGTNSSVIITTKGTYKVVKEINGCFGEQIISVPSIYCKIPKGISPNEDTLNDFFDLSNLGVKELQIYNRYGTEVYSKKDYKKEWTGKTNSGKELPDGTYYYVINLDSGKSKTGWVYINKEY